MLLILIHELSEKFLPFLLWAKFWDRAFYFIPSSEVNAYLPLIKVLMFTLKKYRIFSLVKNTIFIFSL